MKKILSISLGLLLAGVSIAQSDDQVKDNAGKEEKPEKVKVEKVKVEKVKAEVSNDQIQNKNGVDMMPVKGEFAIGTGINMVTFTGFLGNMLNNNTGNNLGNSLYRSNGLGGVMVFGKYMTSDNNAYRLGFYNDGFDVKERFEVYDDLSNDPDTVVLDTYRQNFSSTTISVGYEFRRGKTRLRGIYGADALVSWSGGYHETYSYGNAMTYQNMAPLNFMGNEAERTLTTDGGAAFGLGVRAFAGVEYFVTPKICIGTEFGWSINYTNTSKSKEVTERFDIFAIDADNPLGQVVTKETNVLGSRSITSGLDNANSQIYVTFYF